MLKKSLEHFRTKVFQHSCVVLLLATMTTNTLHANDLTDAERAIRVRQYDVAFHLYQTAAQAGNAEAQYQLANLYSSGTGVKANEDQALAWLEAAAAQDHPAAIYSLAVRIQRKDSARAQSLMEKSASLSYRPATLYLERAKLSQGAIRKDEKAQIDLWFGSAQNNSVNKLLRLRNQGIAIDQQDAAGRTALFAAIESNASDVVEWLLKHGANPNHRDKFGGSPAFVAISADRYQILQRLLNSGLDIQQTLTNSDTLLHYAIRREHYRFASLLVEANVPINHQNDDGWTALDLARYAKANKTIAMLKEHGANRGSGWNNAVVASNANVSSTDRLASLAEKNNISLAELGQIVISGNTELFQQIIKRQRGFKDKINQKLDDGSTLISLAAKEGNSQMVKMLLDAGSYSSIPTFSGMRPLHIAARAGHLQIIEQLLSSGADILQRDDQNRDAIQWAIQERQQAASALLVDTLLTNKGTSKKAAQLDNYLMMASQYKLDSLVIKLGPYAGQAANDHIGRNALWFAAQNRNAAIIPQLLQYGIPPNDPDHEGKTPFYVAISSDCLACAEQLIHYADIDQQIKTGNSPLIAASENKNSLLVDWLLKQGADTELTNELRNTALISAVEADAPDVVKLLVEAGANGSRKNNFGFSALDIAKGSNQEIYAYLKSRSILGGF